MGVPTGLLQAKNAGRLKPVMAGRRVGPAGPGTGLPGKRTRPIQGLTARMQKNHSVSAFGIEHGISKVFNPLRGLRGARKASRMPSEMDIHHEFNAAFNTSKPKPINRTMPAPQAIKARPKKPNVAGLTGRPMGGPGAPRTPRTR